MGFPLLPENTRELWKEWELRLLVLVSLFLQLTLVTQGFRRKSSYKYWIQVVVWTTYLLADFIPTLALGVLSNRLATIKETKGTIDPESQITAFWAPFLLLHLGGPDTITAYALEDNELWLRQLARLCVQVGLACYIYFMALSRSTLSILAAGMILVGFIKYVERTLCLYLASEGQLRDSMLSHPDFGPIYPRIVEQHALKKEEGYQVDIDEVTEVPAPEDLSANSGQAIDQEKAATLVKAYELFKISKLLFVGLILNTSDRAASKHMFVNRQNMNSKTAFGIVEVELGFMYDLLYTKAPLLNCAWGIIRWVINLSVLCAVLVFFSMQDRKDYLKVDIYITFLLVSAAILLEIYSVLLTISSDWVDHRRLQRPGGSTVSSAMASLQICPNPRWSHSVAQLSLLKLSIGRRNRKFSKLHPRFAKLDEKLEKNVYINYKGFKNHIKEWTFDHMRDTIDYLDQDRKLKSGLKRLKLEASEVLKRSNNGHLNWSVNDMEFDQSILIWHIATELCHYKDLEKSEGEISEHIKDYKMSKLVSRYMLYLLVLHPSMLPTGIGMLRYEDTSVDAQKFFEDKLETLSKRETSINSSAVKTWAQNLFKKEKHGHTGVKSCSEAHKSTESRDLCEVCHLLLHVGTQLPATKIRGGKSRSVLFDACHLASQLNKIESEDLGRKWKLIGKVWAKFLIYAACLSRGYQHSENLSRGGELITHVWLLMAHLGVVEPVQTSEKQCITKLVLD
ncbi:uncharacterized protein LOC104423969 [Eucalyptus grandis]|uniref:Uncharacterized protein n=2 Tax=Eucalyptus grandis TaxID=71139 RepID=A0ACC3J8H6_EUCGR|nr:uncharacterized protein LOC104423969 [Eucalyptus grandis]KAK3410416.1 hypothetical protein EUGRSUZ_J02410 [Eucalyptus grandis]